jgi:enoyl-CoA hydratase
VVGLGRALDLILTGRAIDAAEAERAGLVARVIPAADLLDTALAVAAEIAAMPPLAVIAAKELVDAAGELPLSEGIRLERRLFHMLAATDDKTEGMAAFIEKRKPEWKGR